MPIETVLDALIFWNSSAGATWSTTKDTDDAPNPSEFEAQIRAALTDVYAKSSSFREMLDGYISTGGEIRIGYTTSLPGVFHPSDLFNTSHMALNLERLSDFWYVTSTGEVRLFDLRVVLAHELSHMISGTVDALGPEDQAALTAYQNGEPNYDYRGTSVQFENVVERELAWSENRVPQERASYHAYMDNSGFLTNSGLLPGVSYSNGEEVDVVRLDKGGLNLLDMTSQQASRDLLFGGKGDDVIRAGGGRDHLYGGAGNDTLEGGEGNDRLFGEADDDILEGGAGADLLDGGEGIDTASYWKAGAAVTVDLSAAAGNMGQRGEAIGDTFSSIENLTGSAYADILKGNGLANVIRGDWGNDELYGYGGNDVLVGGAGNDKLFGGEGDDVLYGGDQTGSIFIDDFDTLYGEGGNDTIHIGPKGGAAYGGVGSNVIYAGNGTATVYGGAGSDTIHVGASTTISYEASASAITFDLANGQISGGDADNDTIIGTPYRVLGSNLSDTFIANPNGSTMIGGGGADTYVMGAGADTVYDTWGAGETMWSGFGADIDYRQAPSGITINAVLVYGLTVLKGTRGWADGDTIDVKQGLRIFATEFDDVINGRNYSQGGAITSPENGTDTILTYGGNDIINAGGGTNYIEAGEGNDRVSTTWGSVDTVYGGDGDDYIDVSNGADKVHGGSGYNTIVSVADADVDIFDLGDGGHLSYGSAYGNAIVADLGSRAISFKTSPTGPILNANDTIIGHLDAFTGSTLADDITGSSAGDTIVGGGGRDIIRGMDGDDNIRGVGAAVLDGGDGNDRIVFTGNTQTVQVLGGTGNDYVWGNGWADVQGGGGNDTIYAADPNAKTTYLLDMMQGSIRGGEGQDTILLAGGYMNLTVYLSGDGDTVGYYVGGGSTANISYAEAGSGVTIGVNGAGTDIISGSYGTLQASAQDDVIYSSSRFSSIDAGAGNDVFYGTGANSAANQGGAGDDTFYGWTGGFRFTGGAGNDTAFSGAGNDTFVMDGGNDTFFFGAGASVGLGADTLQGFTPGQDLLVLNASARIRKDVNDRDGDGDKNETYVQDFADWFSEIDPSSMKIYSHTASGDTDYSNFVQLAGVNKGMLSEYDFLFA